MCQIKKGAMAPEKLRDLVLEVADMLVPGSDANGVVVQDENYFSMTIHDAGEIICLNTTKGGLLC